MKFPLIVLMVLVTTGFTHCQRKPNPPPTIVEVPVCPEGTTAVNLPEKPILLSASINEASPQDDVIKAAISDLFSLKLYSEQLENLINTRN